MSDVEDSSAPRRSQRDKKKATHFVSVNSTLLKRKRSDATTDDDAQSELSDEVHNDEDQEVEEYRAPKPQDKSPVKPKRKAKAAPSIKKPRATKVPSEKNPAAKVSAPRPRKNTARKGKQAIADGEF
ncbi:hypothetical protein A0H81_03251 [Grifola frondosa]|uniref:Uncharacterized protein n=1 Tax=Grifola frondosa TaxID=5627 RepID=A0A1C7MGZ2_GRIFR|nr:hypothetical protein A0H81_03251 [Grifola frondosa]